MRLRYLPLAQIKVFLWTETQVHRGNPSGDHKPSCMHVITVDQTSAAMMRGQSINHIHIHTAFKNWVETGIKACLSCFWVVITCPMEWFFYLNICFCFQEHTGNMRCFCVHNLALLDIFRSVYYFVWILNQSGSNFCYTPILKMWGLKLSCCLLVCPAYLKICADYYQSDKYCPTKWYLVLQNLWKKFRRMLIRVPRLWVHSPFVS